MTPERENQIRENLFEMWFELLRRCCEDSSAPDLGGTDKQLSSEYRVLEESKDILKTNFIKFYHLEQSILDRQCE